MPEKSSRIYSKNINAEDQSMLLKERKNHKMIYEDKVEDYVLVKDFFSWCKKFLRFSVDGSAYGIKIDAREIEGVNENLYEARDGMTDQIEEEARKINFYDIQESDPEEARKKKLEYIKEVRENMEGLADFQKGDPKHKKTYNLYLDMDINTQGINLDYDKFFDYDNLYDNAYDYDLIDEEPKTSKLPEYIANFYDFEGSYLYGYEYQNFPLYNEWYDDLVDQYDDIYLKVNRNKTYDRLGDTKQKSMSKTAAFALGGKSLARIYFWTGGELMIPEFTLHLKKEVKKIRNVANSDLASFVINFTQIKQIGQANFFV